MSAEAPTTSKPPVLLMLGLAGAGKTTLMQRLVSHIQQKQKQGEPSASTSAVYTINLDPAVANVPYPVNVDIRDTVNYKEVMDQ